VKNGFVSVNFGCVARQGVGKSLGRAAIVSMYLLGFDAAIHSPKGSQGAASGRTTMVTIDILTGIFYSQLLLSLALFFFVQLLVLAARDKIERVADWFIYKATWFAVCIQVVFMLVVGILVWYTPTDPVTVGHATLLILVNLAWFVSLRVVFEFVDYYLHRSSES